MLVIIVTGQAGTHMFLGLASQTAQHNHCLGKRQSIIFPYKASFFSTTCSVLANVFEVCLCEQFHGCVCVFLYVWVCVYTCVHRGLRSVSSTIALPYIPKQGLSLSPEFTTLLSLTKPGFSREAASTRWGYRRAGMPAQLLLGSGDANSCPRDCGTLPPPSHLHNPVHLVLYYF